MAETQQEKIEQQRQRILKGLTDGRSRGMMAMPDSPLGAVSRALTRILEDTVREHTLERDGLMRDIGQMDETINKFGVAWWSIDGRLLLLTPHLLQQVPDNVQLESISGEKKLAKAVREGDALDTRETRFGVTAWGIPLVDAPAPAAIEKAKRKHRRVRPVPATPTTGDSIESEPLVP